MEIQKHELVGNWISQELSWLAFNQRVLEEAQDNCNPLLERLKFAAIVSSNLDEFFMVRMAALWAQAVTGEQKNDLSGLTPQAKVAAIVGRTRQMVQEQYRCFKRSLIPWLKKEKVFFLTNKNLSPQQKAFIDNYYEQTVLPLLKPVVIRQDNPFPLIGNRSLNIAVLLEDAKVKDKPCLATIELPSALGRFIGLPSAADEQCFILLEEIVRARLGTFFRGQRILAAGCYRITRNADIDVVQEKGTDLLQAVARVIRQRQWGKVIRLEIEQEMDARLREQLAVQLGVIAAQIYRIPGPLDLTFLMQLSVLPGNNALRYPYFSPQLPPQTVAVKDIFTAIAANDILLHHPYDAFDPVVRLVAEAADDPQVVTIQQTLYRVSRNSRLIEALAQAARNGKQVTVLVELRARFDEENNIRWARYLAQAGCHVLYGLPDSKTHCKILLVTRREGNELKRYVHLGTGNYNEVTAKLYVDLGLLTADPVCGADAAAIFAYLAGDLPAPSLQKLIIAPFTMRQRFLALIRREAAHARQGKPAHIIAKVNSLGDPEIISALYAASRAGVEIDLIVRGICCLKPGVPGVSEHIRVRSIVGRFLEHSRIFYFANSGAAEYYLASADWMPRNLDRRIETLFPIEDTALQHKLHEILMTYLRDTQKARILQTDGSYRRARQRGRRRVNSQELFIAQALRKMEN